MSVRPETKLSGSVPPVWPDSVRHFYGKGDHGVEESELDRGGEVERVAQRGGVVVFGALVFATTGQPPPGDEGDAGEGGDGEREDQRFREGGGNHGDDGERPREHHGGGGDDGHRVVERLRGLFLAAAGEGERGGGRRRHAAEHAREEQACAGAEQPHGDVARETDAGDQHDHQPGVVGIECAVRAEVAIRHERENDAGDGDELQGGADVVAGEGAGPGVKRLLAAEEHHRGGGDEHGGGEFVPENESASEHREQGGGEGRGAGVAVGVGRVEFRGDLLGADDEKNRGEQEGRRELARVGADAAEHRPERVGADAAEVGFGGAAFLVAPLADEPDQGAETDADDDSGEERRHGGVRES